MHLYERIVNLSTKLTHPRFFVLTGAPAHESQALFRLITDGSEAFRSLKMSAFERSKEPPGYRRQALPLRKAKNASSKTAVCTAERPIFNNPFLIDFSTLFGNSVILYVT
jgi:hypothetical protein